MVRHVDGECEARRLLRDYVHIFRTLLFVAAPIRRAPITPPTIHTYY